MKRQFKFFSDPGHAWLEVPMADVRKLGLEKQISRYSYRHMIGGTEWAYLEEDDDAGKFIRAYGENAIELVYVSLYGDAAIRDYPSFY